MISSELRRYVSNPMYQLPGSRNGKFGRHSLELPGLSIDPGVVLHSRHLLLYASHFCAMFELIPVEYEHLAAVDLPRPRPRSGAEVVLALIRPATNTRGVPGLYARAGRRLLVLRPPEVLLPGVPSSAGFHGFPVRSSI